MNPNTITNACEKKCKREWLSLEKKIEIINLFENGENIANIARKYSKNESSVRSIIRKSEEYKREQNFCVQHKLRCRRDPIMNYLERLLLIWIEDCKYKRISLNMNLIQEKALELYKSIKVKNLLLDRKDLFSASRSWFFRFKNRIQIPLENTNLRKHDIVFHGQLQDYILKENIKQQQIFTVYESRLFWNRMPSNANLVDIRKNQHESETLNDCLTLLLGGNASGDFQLQPLAIMREIPDILKVCRGSLPVNLSTNNKVWITKELFLEWFKHYFCPIVEQYCQATGIKFKILLLLDNTLSNLTDSKFNHKNVKIFYFPPNSLGILENIDVTFKATYLRRFFSHTIENNTKIELKTLQKLQNNYNIKDALINIVTSWNQINHENICKLWKSYFFTKDLDNYSLQIQSIIEDLVQMVLNFGLRTITSTQLLEYISSHNKPFDNATLFNIEQEDYTNQGKISTRELQLIIPQSQEFIHVI